MSPLEVRLRAEIVAARAEGWTIAPSVMRHAESRQCCSLGAVVRDVAYAQYSELYDAAASRLGLTQDQLGSIFRGFDTSAPPEYFEVFMKIDRELFAVGRRLRDDFLGG